MTPAVVFDCVAFLRAATSPTGPGAACLDVSEHREVNLCVSGVAITELRNVLTRPRTKNRFPPLTNSAVEEFLQRISRVARRIDPVPEVFVLARDPKDSKRLNLAIAAGAARVVSRDNDRLDLMTAADPDAVTFRTTYPGTAILDPASSLRTVRSPPPPAEPTTPPDSET